MSERRAGRGGRRSKTMGLGVLNKLSDFAAFLKNRSFAFAAALVAFLILAPILSVALTVFEPFSDVAQHMFATVAPRYFLNTLLLGAMVAIFSAMIGVGAAWLVTMRIFPGRALFEWALALPMAFPAYVMAYAYTDLLDHPGPVQTGLRTLMGWGPRDYWFPEVRSLEGAAVMLTLVLYPYVYLLARASFIQQSSGVMEVARTLGAGPWGVFWRIGLPMARPAIATGVALVLMETLADYGVVAHFSVQTIATGVYRAWFSMGDRIAAAQLAAGLLIMVAFLVALERTQRGASLFQETRAQFKALKPPPLHGVAKWLAAALCAVPVIFGFVVPMIMLLWMSVEGGHSAFGPRYIGFALNSFTLAAAGSGVTVLLAVLLAYAARLTPGRLTRWASIGASMGYAIPGYVIAIGLMIPLAQFDNAFDAFMRKNFDVSTGLLLTGSIIVLLYAYVVRFMSIALQTVEASLAKVSPAMDHAARALGENPRGVLLRVHARLVSGGLFTAALLVFVDVMKELPATLIMQPFNFTTLAVQAHRLASDERLLEASTPSLTIVLVSLAPVLMLTRRIRRSRPGEV